MWPKLNHSLSLLSSLLPQCSLSVSRPSSDQNSGEGFLSSACLSLSPSLPCHLSLFLTLSLQAKNTTPQRSTNSGVQLATCAIRQGLEYAEMAGPSFPASQSPPSEAVGHAWGGRGSPASHAILRPILMAKLGANKFPSACSSHQYPPFTIKSARIISTLFCTKTTNFASCSEPNEAFF